MGIMHAERLVLRDDPPAAFGCLPFQRVAGQHLVSRPLPDKAPELLLSFGSFASLNSSRHNLQLVPCPGRLAVSVLPQKVGAIIQKSDVGTIRQDRKSTRLNSSHQIISYAVFC